MRQLPPESGLSHPFGAGTVDGVKCVCGVHTHWNMCFKPFQRTAVYLSDSELQLNFCGQMDKGFVRSLPLVHELANSSLGSFHPHRTCGLLRNIQLVQACPAVGHSLKQLYLLHFKLLFFLLEAVA